MKNAIKVILTKMEWRIIIPLSLALIILIISVYINVPKIVIGVLMFIIGSIFTFLTNNYLSDKKFKQQLALTALDRKLETHQKAYSIWWDIRSNIYDREKIGSIIENAQIWWQDNCLFLFPDSRKAFHDCLIFAFNHLNLVSIQNPDFDYRKDIKESWDVIIKPGIILAEEIELPAFVDQEKYFPKMLDT